MKGYFTGSLCEGIRFERIASSLFYVKTVDADVSNLNEIKKNPIQSRTNPNKLSVVI